MSKRNQDKHTNGTIAQNLPFPVDVFPPKTRHFIQETATSIGVENSLPASILLSVVSAAIGGAARIQVKEGYYENAPIWTAVIAPPGKAKSPVFMQVLEPLEKIQADADRTYEEEMQSYKNDLRIYKAAMQRWRKIYQTDPTVEMPEEPIKPFRERILLDNASAYSVVETLHQCPFGCMLNRDELSGLFDELGGKNGGIDLDQLLSTYTGKSIRYSRYGKEDLVIRRPTPAISGTIQPKRLKRLFQKDSALEDSGLSSRFLYSMPPDKTLRWSRKTIEQRTKEVFSDLIRIIFNMRHSGIALGSPMEFSGSSQANDIYDSFHEDNATKCDHETSDMILYGLSKMPIHVSRIALVLHVIKCAESGLPYTGWPLEVGVETMSDAVTLVEWYENELRKVAALIYGDDDTKDHEIRRILETIGRSEKGTTIRELQRSSRRHNDADQLERRLREMVKQNLLGVRIEKATNGRAVEHFFLLPAVGTDTMDETADENPDSISTEKLHATSSPVDTILEKAGKNSVNVDLSQKNPCSNLDLSIHQKSKDTGDGRSFSVAADSAIDTSQELQNSMEELAHAPSDKQHYPQLLFLIHECSETIGFFYTSDGFEEFKAISANSEKAAARWNDYWLNPEEVYYNDTNNEIDSYCKFIDSYRKEIEADIFERGSKTTISKLHIPKDWCPASWVLPERNHE